MPHGRQVEPPVDGDGVVDGGDQRGAEGAGAAEQAVAEGLVVVDDIELVAAGGEVAPGPQREGQRLGEAAGPHRADLKGVDPVPVLAALRRTERVRLAVEVQAGQLGQGHPVVDDGVGLGADDLDGVAEAGEFAREVAYIDALSAAERVPLIREHRDP